MGSRPDPGFARRGGAAPFPESFCFGLATLSQPGGAFERGRGPALSRTPSKWLSYPTQPSSGRGGHALPYVAPLLLGNAFAAWPRLGALEGAGARPDPSELAPSPTRAPPGGEGPLP